MTGLLSVAGSTPSDSGFELKSARFDATAYLTRAPSQNGNQDKLGPGQVGQREVEI